jgi:hypothetical protein
MLLKLREARIEELQRNSEKCPHNFDDNNLKEEINQLKYQLNHHPEVLRLALENLELRGMFTSVIMKM